MKGLYRRIIDATLSGVVGLAITLGFPIFFQGFRDVVAAYPRTELVGAAIIVAILIVVDLVLPEIRSRIKHMRPLMRNVDLAPYLLSAMLFVVLTLLESRGPTLSSAPIYLSLLLLLFLTVARQRLAARNPPTVSVPTTGLAATSVLIVQGGKEEHFLLLLNKNLNSGRGLWVSPGGHFDIGTNPADRLVAKIRSEVGIAASIWTPPALATQETKSFSTVQTRWLTPPIFILDEDLLGVCSHGHRRHFDLVYVCQSVGNAEGGPAKYGPGDLVRVPVSSCLPSAEHAEAAVGSAVQEWYRSHFGAGTGVLDTVTRDVAQRLHLVARLRSMEKSEPMSGAP